MSSSVTLYSLKFSNGKEYIGIAQDPRKRFIEHCQAATRGSHYAVHAAFRKHGRPTMGVLCIGARSYIADLEVKAIAAFRTRERLYGYNQAPGGETSPVAGIGHTLESRTKMSKGQKRRKRTPEELRRMKEMSTLAAAKRSSPEYRAKQSAAAKLRWQTKPFTPEMCELVRAASLGNKNCVGRVLSAETRAKISASLKGNTATKEAREKMSRSQKARWHGTVEKRTVLISQLQPIESKEP